MKSRKIIMAVSIFFMIAFLLLIITKTMDYNPLSTKHYANPQSEIFYLLQGTYRVEKLSDGICSVISVNDLYYYYSLWENTQVGTMNLRSDNYFVSCSNGYNGYVIIEKIA